MRYEDASHTGAFTQGSEPDARNDADAIAAGAQGPATGNVITGEGTQTGPSGSDYGPGAHITTIAGAGGEDSSFAGGKLAVSGEFGRLSIDAEGNYSYVAKAGTPENSRDTFTYTLADAQGNADTATLMIEIGKTPAVIKANAQQVVPGPDGVVILPPGVELSDIQVVGRNLVINLPDGSQMVIIDGAVFVPQLVLGGVEVPATNLAALLVGQEIAPAAGEGPPLSSGGNFDVPVPPLDPGIPLGDLLPPTELFYTPPEVREVFDLIDEEPEIFIQPDGQPATVAAVDSVDEKGLPERNEGEPEGSGEEAAAGADGDPSEATGGTIVVNSPDGVDSLTITGADGIPREIVVGLIVEGEFGTLTITGAVGSNFTYSYVLDDNIDHSDGVPDHDDFSVTLTDNDGDQATATLQIDIADDTPTARPDTDVVPAGEFGPVTGNVITDDSPTNGDDGDGDNGRDTVGADDADLTAVTGFGSTEATEGGFIVQGQYGVLTISSDGEYSYLRNEGTPGGVTDVFNYTLTDGDGDTSATTLTITIEDTPPTIDVPVAGEDGTLVNEKGLPERDGNLPNEPAGTGEAADGDGTDNDDGSETTSGTVNFTEGDGPATIRIDGVIVTGVGQEFAGAHGTLTITAVGPTSVSYSYTLTDNTSGDATFDDFAFSVTDSDGDVASGTLTIDIIDDTPLASPDTDIVPAGTYGPATGNVITDAEGDPDSGKDNVGADNAVVAGVAAGDTGTDLESAATVGAVVQGAFGKLTLNADGSYSYVRDPGTDGGVSDVFTYTLRDGDGDLVSTTLTITIENSPPTIDVPTEGEAGTVVDEKGLPERDGNLPDEPAGTGEAADGNGADNDDTSETTTGTVNFTPGDGPATIRIDGVIVTAVNQEFVGAHGTLTVTAIGPTSISYSYTLTDNTSGDATFDDFAFSVTDQDDDVANGTLTIDIVDDAPIANDDSNSVSEGSSVNGNVLPNDLSGADDYDGAVVGGVTGNDDGTDTTNMVGGQIVLVGTFGTLTLNDDGSYTYDADPNTNPPADAVDEFVYTIRDGDGDLDSAVLTIDVNDVNLPADNQNKVVNEAALDLNDDGSDLAAGSVTGSNPSSTAETVSGTLNVAGAVSYVIVGSSTGTHGIIQVNSDGTYTYTLTDPVDGATADNGTNTFDNVETFTYEADDGNGNTVQGTITIDVIDDVPTAHSNVNSVSEGGSVGGNVLTDATDDVFGADGQAPGGGVTGVATGSNTASPVSGGTGAPLVGTYGTLTLNADGTYTYEANPDVINSGSVVDHFVYTITDGDGDTSTTTLDITINDVTLSPDNQNKVVNEAALDLNDDGSDLAAGSVTGSNPSSTAETVSGTLNVAGAVSYVIVGSSTGTHGIIQINSDGTYIYTLTDPVDGPTADNGTNTIDNVETFTYEADDGNGNTVQGTITIDVIDDVPTAAVSTAGFTLAHDETPGLQDTDVAGPLAAFAGVANTGDDPDVLPNGAGSVIGFATSTGAISSTGTVFGADGPAADPNDVVFSLDVFSDGVDSGLNVTSGESILLHEEGGLIVGRVSGGTFNGQAAFAISIDPATGQMSMVQYLSIQHTNTASNDESASIANGAILAVVTTTDGDGDVDTASTGIGNLISFQDDGPTAVAAAAITTGLENGGGDSATASLDTGDGNVFNNFGADGGKVIFTAASIAAMEANNFENSGDALSYVISEDGQTMTGFVDTDLNGEVDVGETTVLTIELQPDGSPNSYTVTMNDSIDTLTTFIFTDAAYDFVGGNDAWAGFALNDQVEGNPGDVPLNDNSNDLLLTPLGTGTAVNGNANSAGTTGPIAGQNIGDGEGMRLDYVSDLTGLPTAGDYNDPTEQTHDFDNHYLVEGAVLRFGDGTSTLTTSSFKAILVTDAADEAPGDDNVADPRDGASEALVSVTSIAINYDGETETATFDPGDPTTPIVLTVGNAGGLADRTYTVEFVLDAVSGEYYAEVTGIYDQAVQITTFAEVQFNALELLHLGPSSSDADYAITGFGFASGMAADVDFSVPISVVDGDGDTVSSGNLVIHADAPEGQGFAATTMMADSEPANDTSSFSLLASDSQEQQVQKTAANSNTTMMAAAVAAAGFAGTEAAASPPADDLLSDSSEPQVFSSQVVEQLSADDGGDAGSSGDALPEAQGADEGPGNSGGNGNGNANGHDNQLDAGSNQASDQGSAHQAANDDGPAVDAAAAGPVAPSVAMVSAEAMQAAGLDGNAQQGGSVEKVLAEALGHGGPPTVDGLLQAITGHGGGAINAIAHVASPAADAVPAWDMGSHGAFVPGADMMFKMGAEMLHHDAVQPVVNG